MKDDLISKTAAIDAVEDIPWYHQNKNGEMVRGANSREHQAWYKADDVYHALYTLPPAQQWIPCTPESKPKRCAYYLVTDDGYTEEAYLDSDGVWFSLDGNKLKDVTAWMEKPEPYKGGQDEE